MLLFNCEKINLFPHDMRKHKSVIIKQKVKEAWLKNQWNDTNFQRQYSLPAEAFFPGIRRA